ncbi:2'-5' RNA ligase family protein [Paracoccus sp. KR1-242]|uniref:2'-5' RNA ligase family protein n=1 Tax=Paracoccus sp. KR1-242 TaxID=3410028 RepID=UPI003C089DCD
MAHSGKTPSSHFFFFAARPPEDVAEQMADAWQTLGTGEKLRRDKLHMTILLVADVSVVPEGLVDQLLNVGAAVTCPVFDVQFDRLATWRHGRARNNPLVLTVAGGRSVEGEALAAALLSALPEDLRWPRWRLVPHVTLAYGKGFGDDITLPQPIHWQIDSFTLTESLRGVGRHIPLASWRLDRAPDDPASGGKQ